MPVDYENGFKVTLVNSKRHITSSMTLADKGYFEFAIYHLCIANEELIKAFILKMKAIATDFEYRQFNKIFNSHNIKAQLLIRLAYVLFLDLIVFKLLKTMTVKEFFKMKEIKTVLSYYIHNVPKINENDKLVNNYLKLKNACLYIDKKEDNWQSPHKKFNKEMYEVLKVATIFFRIVVVKEVLKKQWKRIDFEHFVSIFLDKNMSLNYSEEFINKQNQVLDLIEKALEKKGNAV